VNVEFDGEVRVTLSERNLLDLMRQRTGEHDNPWLDQKPQLAQLVRFCLGDDGEGVMLRIVVERDEDHYVDRKPGPGCFHGS
jgi:hypothetical protein